VSVLISLVVCVSSACVYYFELVISYESVPISQAINMRDCGGSALACELALWMCTLSAVPGSVYLSVPHLVEVLVVMASTELTQRDSQQPTSNLDTRRRISAYAGKYVASVAAINASAPRPLRPSLPASPTTKPASVSGRSPGHCIGTER